MFGLVLMNFITETLTRILDLTLQIGIPVEQMAKLDANENLHPVPEEMMVICVRQLIVDCHCRSAKRLFHRCKNDCCPRSDLLIFVYRQLSLKHWLPSRVDAARRYTQILHRHPSSYRLAAWVAFDILPARRSTFGQTLPACMESPWIRYTA
jgi:hypothetical protein